MCLPVAILKFWMFIAGAINIGIGIAIAVVGGLAKKVDRSVFN